MVAGCAFVMHEFFVVYWQVGTNKVDVIAFFLVRGGREIFYLTELPTPVTGTGHFWILICGFLFMWYIKNVLITFFFASVFVSSF